MGDGDGERPARFKTDQVSQRLGRERLARRSWGAFVGFWVGALMFNAALWMMSAFASVDRVWMFAGAWLGAAAGFVRPPSDPVLDTFRKPPRGATLTLTGIVVALAIAANVSFLVP